MLRCPNCGARLEIARPEVELTERQRAIRDAIEEIRRDTGALARTEAIAFRLGYAPTTLRPDLAEMEARKIIWRPNGSKSGWGIWEDHISLVQAA